MLRRACGLVLKSNLNGIYRNSTGVTSTASNICPCRCVSQPPRHGKTQNDDMPEAPPMSVEDLDFIEDLVNQDKPKTLRKNLVHPSIGKSSPLPEAPPITDEWEEAEDEDDVEDAEDIESVPYIPPIQKTIMIPGMFFATHLDMFLEIFV